MLTFPGYHANINRLVGIFYLEEVLISRRNTTREKILAMALDLITKNGFDPTSVADICLAANVSKGAFYHYFPSKQALFMELIQMWLDALDVGLHMALDNASSVPEGLLNMAGMTGRIFQEAKDGFPILIEFWRQANLDPVIWQEAMTPYKRYLDYFEKLVLQGIKEGSFDESTDPKFAARLLISMAMGLLLQASFDPESVFWEETTITGMQLIINGLRRLP